MLFWLCCNSILSCLETNFASSPLLPGQGCDNICRANAWQFKAWNTSHCNGTVMAHYSLRRWHTHSELFIYKTVTQLFIYDITAVLSHRSQKYGHPSQHKHCWTRAYVRLRSKYGIPEVTVTGRSCAEAERGRRVHLGGYKRGNRSLLLAVRPRSCWPPSDSQLIVCSTNTLEASRVTLIDERLEFK